jgi:hypothetical protein
MLFLIYWIREIAGWALLVAGLVVFGFVLSKDYGFAGGHYVEGVALTVIGAFVFRGGIHLLKIAVAARMCRETQDRLYPAPAGPPARGPARRVTARRA